MQLISQPLLWTSQKLHSNKVKDNAALKNEIALLKKEKSLIEEVKQENSRLKKLLQLKEESSYEVISAAVFGRDPAHWFRILLINKGKVDGVEVNMPVIHEKGLVGHVAEVFSDSAKVQLMVDYNSRVGALAQRTREVGILKGKGLNGCLLDYLPRDTLIKKGDAIVSSGMGSVYPKGLFLGIVESVKFKKRGLYQTAQVKPAVNFNILEEVMILKK